MIVLGDIETEVFSLDLTILIFFSGSTTGSNYYVRILSTLDRELLKPSASVALHKHSNALVDVLPPEADSSISMLQSDEKPDVGYNDIGGMDMQKQEMREAVELPLTHFDLYKQVCLRKFIVIGLFFDNMSNQSILQYFSYFMIYIYVDI